MPLVFAGIIPHSPATLPHSTAAMNGSITATLAGIKELEGELYVAQPDVLLIISPHAPITQKAFGINLAPQFRIDLQEFGEVLTSTRAGDIALATNIREYADAHHAGPVTLFSEVNVDYGTGVAIYHLTQHLPNVQLVPLSTSLLSISDHVQFGEIIRQVTSNSNKRIAVIASTGLAHTLTTQSPHGYDPAGQTFDDAIQRCITNKNLEEIIKINDTIVQAAQASNAQKTLAILFGSLTSIVSKAKIISYESPLGIGWLVAQFSLI